MGTSWGAGPRRGPRGGASPWRGPPFTLLHSCKGKCRSVREKPGLFGSRAAFQFLQNSCDFCTPTVHAASPCFHTHSASPLAALWGRTKRGLREAHPWPQVAQLEAAQVFLQGLGCLGEGPR